MHAFQDLINLRQGGASQHCPNCPNCMHSKHSFISAEVELRSSHDACIALIACIPCTNQSDCNCVGGRGGLGTDASRQCGSRHQAGSAARDKSARMHPRPSQRASSPRRRASSAAHSPPAHQSLSARSVPSSLCGFPWNRVCKSQVAGATVEVTVTRGHWTSGVKMNEAAL